ncbi:permease prefix domain 1-containing protein [Deinococcus cellulosilyticus]|uniref:Uncharacterized protein n=1 Tax=Deinococcus cellulosilyticus (strain DSM 18568 / NBRC 106333 / KACC 11606 / 5516J-15) TaxID=1223518 RepID=A0A511N3V3_DEIC1|nr:permease prefix domain 1-containing protein [Deinococcus cellulosilyticus]GEM47512.1 hypothetical protein DC3_31470 [Deinococcus cellulosilyticus NBRC 106333 = KACC 11606]
MQKRIEQYLNRATRGLWGRKRQQVKQELYSHIYEKMHFQMSFGKSEEEALESTLQAMGKPREVNAGLFKLHALPALGKMVLITGMLSAAVISQAQHQPSVHVYTQQVQVENPFDARNTQTFPIHYLSAGELAQALQEQQVPFSLQNRQEGNQPAAVLTIGDQTTVLPYQDQHDREGLIKPQGQDHLISIDLLLISLLENDSSRLHGLVNPRIDIGGASFTLGTKEHSFSADTAYISLLNNYMQKHHHLGIAIPADDPMAPRSKSFTLRVPEAKDGEVYALIQADRMYYEQCNCITETGNDLKMATAALAEARDGKITLLSKYPDLKFSALDRLNEGDVLIKLSGEFRTAPFMVVQVNPEDIQP